MVRYTYSNTQLRALASFASFSLRGRSITLLTLDTHHSAPKPPANREVLDPVYVDDGRHPESSPHTPNAQCGSGVHYPHTLSKKRKEQPPQAQDPEAKRDSGPEA